MERRNLIDRLGRVDIDILLAYAKGCMRQTRAAKISHYDSRTVAYHLNAVHSKTGVDPREFSGLTKLVEEIRKHMPEGGEKLW